MSFAARDLSVLAYANGFTLWHYTTADDAVTAAGYFNDASDMLRVGDVIIANVNTDDTVAMDTMIYTVTASGDSGVTVIDFSA